MTDSEILIQGWTLYDFHLKAANGRHVGLGQQFTGDWNLVAIFGLDKFWSFGVKAEVHAGILHFLHLEQGADHAVRLAKQGQDQGVQTAKSITLMKNGFSACYKV